MSTKQIAQIAPDSYELTYQGTIVGYATTEEEGKTRLDEIAYDAERGKPVLKLVEREEDDEELTPEEYAHRAELPVPPKALIDRMLALPAYQFCRGFVAHAGDDRCGNPPIGCTQQYLTGIEKGVSYKPYYVPLLYHHKGELWMSTDDQSDLLIDPEHCDFPMRVLSISALPYTDLIAVVTAEELFLMDRPDVEVQIGTSFSSGATLENAYDQGFADGADFGVKGFIARLEERRAEIRASKPTVQAERIICDDRLDERYGQETGTDFKIEFGDDERVIAWFPDKPKGSNQPELLAFGNEGVSFEELDRVLPMINIVLNDPRVIAARQRIAAGLPPFEEQHKAA
jgi:hypothetical protein